MIIMAPGFKRGFTNSKAPLIGSCKSKSMLMKSSFVKKFFGRSPGIHPLYKINCLSNFFVFPGQGSLFLSPLVVGQSSVDLKALQNCQKRNVWMSRTAQKKFPSSVSRCLYKSKFRRINLGFFGNCVFHHVLKKYVSLPCL